MCLDIMSTHTYPQVIKCLCTKNIHKKLYANISDAHINISCFQQIKQYVYTKEHRKQWELLSTICSLMEEQHCYRQSLLSEDELIKLSSATMRLIFVGLMLKTYLMDCLDIPFRRSRPRVGISSIITLKLQCVQYFLYPLGLYSGSRSHEALSAQITVNKTPTKDQRTAVSI